MDWRNSGQGKTQWPAFVKTVMNLHVLQNKYPQFLDSLIKYQVLESEYAS
jgi:hypothetical protein